MLAKGIPEGSSILEGDISGFLYFPGLVGRMNRISFNMELVDASTGSTFETIRIHSSPSALSHSGVGARTGQVSKLVRSACGYTVCSLTQ